MSTTPEAATATSGNGKRRRIMLVIAAIFVTLGLAWTLLEVFVFSRREKTDDAYVTGNQVRISSQVAGTVVDVFVRNTSRVAAGQVLLKLDPTDAQQALDRAAASLAQTVRQVRQQQAQSSQYDATITARELELRRAEQDLAEREPLLAEQAVAGEEVRHARDAVTLARAQLAQAREQARAARALVDDLPVAENPAVMAARAAYEEAGVGPDVLDVVELQDTDAARQILSAEELGLCPRGGGGDWVRAGGGTMTSSLPVNPSGGLLSKGEPLGASALGQVVELVWQLRGAAGPRQTAEPRWALAHTVGRGANACVVLLTR